MLGGGVDGKLGAALRGAPIVKPDIDLVIVKLA
jgi:hypothetical protein